MIEKLKSTQAIVQYILENCEDARNSDMKLYLIICETLNPKAYRKPFFYVISHLEELGLPPFETVRRTRQKVQAENPELRPCNEVALYRAENETAYEKFATT